MSESSRAVTKPGNLVRAAACVLGLASLACGDSWNIGDSVTHELTLEPGIPRTLLLRSSVVQGRWDDFWSGSIRPLAIQAVDDGDTGDGEDSGSDPELLVQVIGRSESDQDDSAEWGQVDTGSWGGSLYLILDCPADVLVCEQTAEFELSVNRGGPAALLLKASSNLAGTQGNLGFGNPGRDVSVSIELVEEDP